MPLPGNEAAFGVPAAGSLAWPPAAIDGAMPKLNEWAAWYGGNPDTLAAQYGRTGGPQVRPSQQSGGIVGAVARWFWGAPAAIGQSRAKLHIPVASDIATASADLLFAETIKVTPPDELRRKAGTPGVAGQTGAASPAQDRLEAVLDGINWQSFLVEQAEPAAALGGVYHRIAWDAAVADHPLVTPVHADCAWPEFSYGRLRAVTFWDTAYRRDASLVLRILERHEPGRIEWGVYQGTDDKLGRRVDFSALTSLGLAAPNLEGSFDGVSMLTGYPGLTATYVPNLRPTRGDWRLDPLLSNYGRSDYDGIEGLLDAADETMTSWMRDLRLGKGRLVVPESMLTTSSREGVGSFFNVDQEVFVGLNAALEADAPLGQQVTAQQFQLRTREHAETLAGILGAAFRGAGYSQQTFGIAGEAEGTATATEVNARESRSSRTREKKSRYYTDALPRTLEALLAIDSLHFDGAWPLGARPQVAFPDTTRDPAAEATSIQVLRAAQAMSIWTAVKRAQPDLDDDEVRVEVQRIYDDEKALTPAVPDPFARDTDPDDEPDPDAPPEGDPAPVGG